MKVEKLTPHHNVKRTGTASSSYWVLRSRKAGGSQGQEKKTDRREKGQVSSENGQVSREKRQFRRSQDWLTQSRSDFDEIVNLLLLIGFNGGVGKAYTNVCMLSMKSF